MFLKYYRLFNSLITNVKLSLGQWDRAIGHVTRATPYGWSPWNNKEEEHQQRPICELYLGKGRCFEAMSVIISTEIDGFARGIY